MTFQWLLGVYIYIEYLIFIWLLCNCCKKIQIYYSKQQIRFSHKFDKGQTWEILGMFKLDKI